MRLILLGLIIVWASFISPLTASAQIIHGSRGGSGGSGGSTVITDGTGDTTQANVINGLLQVQNNSLTSGPAGSTIPANAAYIGGKGTGNLIGRLACDSYAFYDASTNGATQLVALTSSQVIYVCGYSMTSSSTTANTLKLVYGTGSNCATGQTAITPGVILQASSSTGPTGKVIPPNGDLSGLKTAASNALCVLTNAAAAAQVEVWYTKF